MTTALLQLGELPQRARAPSPPAWSVQFGLAMMPSCFSSAAPLISGRRAAPAGPCARCWTCRSRCRRASATSGASSLASAPVAREEHEVHADRTPQAERTSTAQLLAAERHGGAGRALTGQRAQLRIPESCAARAAAAAPRRPPRWHLQWRRRGRVGHWKKSWSGSWRRIVARAPSVARAQSLPSLASRLAFRSRAGRVKSQHPLLEFHSWRFFHSTASVAPSTCARFEAEMPLDQRLPERSVLDVFIGGAAAPSRSHRADDADDRRARRAAAPRAATASCSALVRRAANLFASLGGPRPGVAYMLPSLVETHATLWGAEAAGYAVPINFLLQPSTSPSCSKASRRASWWRWARIRCSTSGRRRSHCASRCRG